MMVSFHFFDSSVFLKLLVWIAAIDCMSIPTFKPSVQSDSNTSYRTQVTFVAEHLEALSFNPKSR